MGLPIAMVCTGVLVGMGIPEGMGVPESIPMSMGIPVGIGILVSTGSSCLELASPPLPLLCQSCSCSTLSAERDTGYEFLGDRVHDEGAFFCKNAAESAAKQRSSWANSRANPPDDYSDFLISTETSVLMKCTEVKQPWKCQCKGERPPNRH